MSKTIGITLAIADKCSEKLKAIAQSTGKTGDELKKLEKDLKKAEKTLHNFSKNINQGLANVAKVTAIGVGAIGTAIGATIAKTVEQADKIDKMSQKMQMTRQTFQELDYIFAQNGADISIMQTGMTKLSKAIYGATTGVKTNVQTFNELGIKLKDTTGKLKSTEAVMFEALEKLQQMPEGAEKSTLAMNLFGKSASELAPLLNGNAKSAAELRQKFKDLRMGMSDEAINASVKYKDTMDTLNRSFQGIVYSVGADFLPLVQQMAETIQANLPKIKQAVMPVVSGIINVIKWTCDNINILIPILSACVSAFVAFNVIQGTIKTIQTLRAVIQAVTVVQGVWNAIMLANPIGAIAVGIGALIGVISLLVMNWDKITEAVNKAITAMKNFLRIKPAKDIDVSINKTTTEAIDGSHATGLGYVPYDNYIAKLHKGERVLTSSENKNYSTTNTRTQTINVNFYGDLIGNKEFFDNIKLQLGRELQIALQT